MDVGDDFVECGTSDADYAYFGLETGRRAELVSIYVVCFVSVDSPFIFS